MTVGVRMIRIAVTSTVLSLVVVAGCAPEPPASGPAGLVIVNARVIDGSGGPSRDMSVRVVGERIAAIGDFEPSASDTVLDAGGLTLAPGFVDAHSHHDSGLLDMPDAMAVVSQGITTIVAGQDGGQQYPLAHFFADLEASPASISLRSRITIAEISSSVASRM